MIYAIFLRCKFWNLQFRTDVVIDYGELILPGFECVIHISVDDHIFWKISDLQSFSVWNIFDFPYETIKFFKARFNSSAGVSSNVVCVIVGEYFQHRQQEQQYRDDEAGCSKPFICQKLESHSSYS